MPAEIINRKKKGFSIPLNIWLWENGKFRDLIYDIIFSSTAKKRGFFNYKVIERMFYEHDRLIQFHGQRIWSLFMFEMWQRSFIDR